MSVSDAIHAQVDADSAAFTASVSDAINAASKAALTKSDAIHAAAKADDDVLYLFLQKQKIALRHIPFGYSPPRNKEAHVNDAFTMILVVQWWFFVPFGKRGRVLNALPVNHPRCPFIQMPDTDVTSDSCLATILWVIPVCTS